ncbi:hypothetical protein [Mucilaginibacter sp. AK015]|uniref:hypothetical protein n=1 Tax=Mucilaginibacter sp. AK015 TaxID=2723072 RepID=UPI0016196BCE|nr:hypothetical protein [Mucilaginibacter sp. AK015]MBB5396683.1 hypothetical protein [Mucilaginibacter sp. AK015]
MNNITKGLIAGIIFGIVSILPMLAMKFGDKTAAMTASFISRFAIGFIIFNMQLPMHGWLKGALIGIVLSLPDALVTKKYAPIIGLGLIGGIVCGIFAG